MSGPTPCPFIIKRDGTVTVRGDGAVIGRVNLDPEAGWIGFGVGDVRITTLHWNGRKYAARAVWEASPYYRSLVRTPCLTHVMTGA